MDKKRNVNTTQDKHKEVEFFDRDALRDEYNVFTVAASRKLVDVFSALSGLPEGSRIADLGCGSGVFTNLLRQKGYDAIGLDISAKQVEIAQSKYPDIQFVTGDVEDLPFPSESLDGVLLSGVVHHLPDPRRCAAEVFRVTKHGGHFMAFDPNRRNPFMWLYRDKSSPFYSNVGVTANERPVLAEQIQRIFVGAGFKSETDFLAGLAYRHVASSVARVGLPVYNFLDRTVFGLSFLKAYSPFVLTFGEKL